MHRYLANTIFSPAKPSSILNSIQHGIARLCKYACLFILTGCAAFTSYDQKSEHTLQLLRMGDTQSALNTLAKYDVNDEDGALKKMLPFMEKGYLEAMNSNLSGAIQSWKIADQSVQEWEELAKLNSAKLFEGVGSLIVNDKVRKYDPANYEKVFLTTNIAVSHAAMGNWDLARTEVKKTHERESVIAEINSKKYARTEEKAEKSEQSVKSYKELDGYPVEIFESEKVLRLKNSYQNTLSHYLAGFVYEALNETSLAAPGYRKAIELTPNASILEQGLAQLDSRKRAARRQSNLSDVLFIISSGEIAKKKSQSIPVPVFTRKGVIMAPVSFPIYETSLYPYYDTLRVDGTAVSSDIIMDVDAMAIKELKDEMPGIILRSTIRAAAKALAQKEAQAQNVWAGLALTVASLVTESADERMWRTLPSKIKIWRQLLPQGMHDINVGESQFKINIKSPYTVVPIRVIGNHAYLELNATPVASALMTGNSHE